MEKKNKYIFYLLSSISFILLLLNLNSFVSEIKLILSFIFNPELTSQNIKDFSELSDRTKMIFECEKENSKLKKELSILKEKLVFYEPAFNENLKLKEILSTSLPSKIKGCYAYSISYNPYDPYSFFYINKGSKDEVKIYNPVIFFDNFKKRWRIIGRVVEVYPSYSKVMMITHLDFSFVVMTSKSKGLASSEGKGKIIYKYIEGDVSVGDEVLTADTSYTFPPFIYIGDISNVKKTSDVLFVKAELTTFNPKDIDAVYVIDWQPPILKEEL